MQSVPGVRKGARGGTGGREGKWQGMGTQLFCYVTY